MTRYAANARRVAQATSAEWEGFVVARRVFHALFAESVAFAIVALVAFAALVVFAMSLCPLVRLPFPFPFASEKQ